MAVDIEAGVVTGPAARGTTSVSHHWSEDKKKMDVQSRRRLERTVYFASPVLFLALWQLASTQEWIDRRFFPPPTDIFSAIRELAENGQLWDDVTKSLTRIGIGFVMGAIPGILIGLAIGLMPMFRAFVQPIVDATFPLPKLALVPLFILVFGIGEMSKYMIVASAVFYLVLINTADGVRHIDSIYFDVAKNSEASRWLMFRKVALPGALPDMMTGLRLALGIALLVIVGAEFINAREGVGYLIWSSWQTFRIDYMYAGLFLAAAIGIVFAVSLRALEKFVIPWKPERY